MIALLTAPLGMIVLLPLSLVSPEFIPDVFTEVLTPEETATLLLMGVGVGSLGASWRNSAGRDWPSDSCGGATESSRRDLSLASRGECRPSP